MGATGSASAAGKKPTNPGCAIGCLVIVVLVVIGAIMSALGLNDDDKNDASRSPHGTAYGAWDVCQSFVDDELKAPSTSDYPDISEATITRHGDTWDVAAYVDAENSFGAKVRALFTCTVRHVSGLQYRRVDVQLIE